MQGKPDLPGSRSCFRLPGVFRLRTLASAL